MAAGPSTDNRDRPPYALASVDNALRLIILLRQRDRLGVSEAALALGVAKSTAHRLLAMLVFRGFASQEPDHSYRLGSVLAAEDQPESWPILRQILHPHLEWLAQVSGETANAQVLTGPHIRFIDSVQGSAVLRVADRRGVVLRADTCSGGRALLSLLSREELVDRFRTEPIDIEALQRALSRIRRQGFAFNLGSTEPDVRAVAVPVRNRIGIGLVAVVISVPSVRFGNERRMELAYLLKRYARSVQADLDAAQVTVLD